MTQPQHSHAPLDIAGLETVYDLLATAIDRAGPDKTELFLVKLALLNAQALGDAAGLARGEAVVEQEEVREAVVQVEVGEHPAGAVRDAGGDQRLAVA